MLTQEINLKIHEEADLYSPYDPSGVHLSEDGRMKKTKKKFCSGSKAIRPWTGKPWRKESGLISAGN